MGKETASFWAGIKRFEDILALDPRAYSFAPLAEIYRKLGLPDEALRIARTGAAIHPEFAAGQMALASACIDKQLVAEAKQALEVVVRITPENLVAQRMLAGIYREQGDEASAAACMGIVANLDLEGGEEFAPAAAAEIPAETVTSPTAALMEMEGEEEILELTDDLIEEEVAGEEMFSHFAAAPERPSLIVSGERERPVFVPITAAQESLPAQTPAPVVEAPPSLEEAGKPPVYSATIAELYVSQGLVDKGVEVYRELLREDPDNAAYRNRCEELAGGLPAGVNIQSAAAPPVEEAVTVDRGASGEGLLATLEGWLGNIRRVRECRTGTL